MSCRWPLGSDHVCTGKAGLWRKNLEGKHRSASSANGYPTLHLRFTGDRGRDVMRGVMEARQLVPVVVKRLHGSLIFLTAPLLGSGLISAFPREGYIHRKPKGQHGPTYLNFALTMPARTRLPLLVRLNVTPPTVALFGVDFVALRGSIALSSRDKTRIAVIDAD